MIFALVYRLLLCRIIKESYFHVRNVLVRLISCKEYQFNESERIVVFVVYNLFKTMSKLATFHLFRAATDDCFVT